jgi:hypothetical protein
MMEKVNSDPMFGGEGVRRVNNVVVEACHESVPERDESMRV